MKDYVPDALSELADALANPIAYQSMIEKRAKQLEALTEEDQLDSADGDDGGECGAADELNLDDATTGGDAVNDEEANDEEPEEASVASISRRMRSVRQLFSSQSSSSGPAPGQLASVQALNEPRDSIGSLGNGTTPSNVFSGGSGHAGAGGLSSVGASGGGGGMSAHGHGLLVRQDTQPRSRDALGGEFGASLLRAPSLLESDQAVGLSAESLVRLRESKRVQKVQAEMEREMAALTKKHTRQLDKELALLIQRRDKILSAQNKSRSLLAKTSSKLARKSVSTESR